MRQGCVFAGLGIAVGLGVALGLTRFMSALLFGVSPVDIPTYAVVAAVLAVVVLVASYLPARRAAMVDPIVALRTD
jgi:ABC-type antimicrobial peptide transport system permease subunit